jgi:hypothetical protein
MGIRRGTETFESGTEFGGVDGLITPAERGAVLRGDEALHLMYDQDPVLAEYDDARLPGSHSRAV